MKLTKDKQRTKKQNDALHLLFQMIADALNDGGYDVQLVLKKTLDVSWTKLLVKELLWKRAQWVQLGKKSTAQLTRKEVDKVYDEINNFLAVNFHISEPFPSLNELILQQEMAEKEGK
jgi:hypothetical protein